METKDPSDYLAPDMKYGIRQKFGYQYANEELLSTTTLSARLTDQVAVMTSGTFRAGENVRLGGDLGRLSNSARDTAANLSKIVWRPTPYDEAEFSIQATRQAAQVPFQANTIASRQSSVADRVNRQITYRLGYTHNPLPGSSRVRLLYDSGCHGKPDYRCVSTRRYRFRYLWI